MKVTAILSCYCINTFSGDELLRRDTEAGSGRTKAEQEATTWLYSVPDDVGSSLKPLSHFDANDDLSIIVQALHKHTQSWYVRSPAIVASR